MTVLGLHLRRARVDDAEEVAGWFHDRRSVTLWAGAYAPYPMTEAWIAGEIDRPGRAYYAVCEDDDRPFGLFGLKYDPQARTAHLVRVALAPDARGFGLCALVLRRAAALATQAGAERLTLNVYGSNQQARMAYERAGFFPCEFIAAPEDPAGMIVKMLKPL